jgi:hypothetical protein
MGSPNRLHSGRLVPWLGILDIRLEWKLLKVTSTQAYYNTVTITTVKSVIVQAPLLKEFVNQLVKQQFIPKAKLLKT